MKYHKFIFVSFILISSITFSQTTFNNLDSLLTENFEAVNKRDSVYYLSLVNQPFLFIDKNIRTQSDSLVILKPFTDAFRDLIDELSDMTSSTDFTVKYLSYEFRNKNIATATKGKLPLHVNLVVNDNFVVKMPIVIYTNNGQYSIESPMTIMFAESKE